MDEFKYIVVDQYGDSVRAFFDKQSAKSFIKLRPECRVEDIPMPDDDDLSCIQF